MSSWPVFTKLEEIPEAFRSQYEKGDDGAFHAKQEDTTGLKNTVAALRTEKAEAEKLAKAATDRVSAAERERDALKTQLGDPEGKTAALLKKFDADIAAAVAVVTKERDEASGRLRALTLDDKAKAEFIKAGGRPERAAAALALAKDRLDLAEDRIVVKDAKGAVSTQSIDKFWGEDFKKEMPELFAGTKASGGGAAGINGAGGNSSGLTAEQVLANPGLAFAAADAKG